MCANTAVPGACVGEGRGAKNVEGAAVLLGCEFGCGSAWIRTIICLSSRDVTVGYSNGRKVSQDAGLYDSRAQPRPYLPVLAREESMICATPQMRRDCHGISHGKQRPQHTFAQSARGRSISGSR